MLTGMYGAASAMNALATQQEVIASNLAHASVPGHRGKIVSFAPIELNNNVNGHVSRQGAELVQVTTDFTQGVVQASGRSLDVAINGEGFFAIQGPNGPLYTRNGSFHVDAEGNLITVDGRAVLSESGPIQLPTPFTENNLRITPTGEVFAGEQSVGVLQLTQFANPDQLKTVGTTLFEAGPEAQPQAFTGVVMQGFRESSNVSAVNELVRMLVGMRQFEAAQRTLRSMDSALAQHAQGG